MSVPPSRKRARLADRSGDLCRVALGLAGAALMVASLSACGGEDAEAASAPAASASSDAGSNQSEDSRSSVQLPEGFPEDAPLPEGATLETADVLAAGTAWRLRYSVDIDEEGRVDKYSKRLRDAAFDVSTPSDVNVTGTNDTWRVDAVIRPPSITFQVIKMN